MLGFALAVGTQVTTRAGAQDQVAAFYRGKTIQAVVGYPPGSTFELYLRLFVRHLDRHVPGNPAVIVQHMPGAGSLKATGYLASVAPKDGLVIGMPNPVNTTEPLIDPERTKFDPRQFNWLGSLNSEISTCGFWAKDIKTVDDLKRRQVVVGATGPSSGSTVDARVLCGAARSELQGGDRLPRIDRGAACGRSRRGRRLLRSVGLLDQDRHVGTLSSPDA